MRCGRIWPNWGLMQRKDARASGVACRTCGTDADEHIPINTGASLIVLAAQLQALQTLIGSIEKRLVVQHRANPTRTSDWRRTLLPMSGDIGASAIAATVTDPKAFPVGS